MKRTLLSFSLALVLMSLLAGCYGRRLVNVPNSVDQTMREVEELRENQKETLRRIRQLEARLDENTTSLREYRADTGSRLQELTELIQMLGGRFDESAERFTRLSEKVDEVRYSSQVPSDTSQVLPDSVSLAYTEAAKAYRDAYLDITAGNYELAQAGFEEFLRNFPDTELSDNAQYWIGESFYARAKYEQAYVAFKKVLDMYPQGDKIPSSMLKLAFCSIALGNEEEGKGYLEELIARFPLSDEARLAQERLEVLGR